MKRQPFWHANQPKTSLFNPKQRSAAETRNNLSIYLSYFLFLSAFTSFTILHIFTKMNPNLNDFALLSHLLHHLHPHTHPPLPTQFHQSLLSNFPHLNHPQVLTSLTQRASTLNVAHTLSLLRTIGPRPDPSAVAAARAKIADPHAPDDEAQIFHALVRVDDMHEECVKQFMAAEEMLVEAYAQSVKGVGEEVDEGVVGILRKAETEEVEKVDLSGSQLKILPEAFGKIRGLVVLNLSQNQLEVRAVFYLDLCVCCFHRSKTIYSHDHIAYDVFYLSMSFGEEPVFVF